MSPLFGVAEVTGWLAILPSLAGVIVCAVCLNRSWWSKVLLGGFALQTLLPVAYRVASIPIWRGIDASSVGLWIWFVVTSVLTLAANVAIVWGVGGLLQEVGRKTAGRRTS